MSLGVQAPTATAAFVPTAPIGALNLSSDQEAQIEQILGELQGGVLTPGQAQQQIGNVIHPQADPFSKPTPQHGQPSGQDPLPRLNLTADQRAQIEKIFNAAQSDGSSADDVRARVNAVLTPDQRQRLEFLSSYTKYGSPSPATASLVLYAHA